jgi:bifunctional polynucleotide phosphatase/kinase
MSDDKPVFTQHFGNDAFMILCGINGINILRETASNKIAAFDLDYTLIKPKSGRKFPKDADDWVLLDGVKKKLQEFYKAGYKIVIFTNQGGASFNIDEFKKKIENISNKLEVPLQVFGATEHGRYRKPATGMWSLLEDNNANVEIDLEKSFYVGDAAGRPDDFSDSDLKFALNVGQERGLPLKFYEDIRMVDKIYTKPKHPLDDVSNFDPLKRTALSGFRPSKEQELVILVGPPACGKSTLAAKYAHEGHTVVCQDDLKTKPKVLSTMKKALKEGRSVMVDRKNEYREDREEFIKLTREICPDIEVRIVWFDVPRPLAEHLAAYREIKTGKHIPALVFNKYYSATKGLQVPTDDEIPEPKVLDAVTKVTFQKNLKMVDVPLFCSYLV